MQIQQTNNYSQFETITGNRNISQAKVDGIVSDINNGLNLLPYCPIIVYDDGKLNIVDGQHRFEVSKTMGLPVYYVVANEISLQNIAQMNSRQEKWKAQDFIHCYIKVGIEDYQVLLDVITRFKIGVALAIDLLMNNKTSGGGYGMDKFRSGNFKVNFKDETLSLLELTQDLFGRYTFSTDRKLVDAVRQVKDAGQCDFEVLKEKINRNPVLMDKQISAKDYIFNIERVYNHNNQKRQVIF